jgi:dihydropteroate synthase
VREPGVLRLGRHSFAPRQLLVMAIVNRTPDSFFQPGDTWDEPVAMQRVHEVIAQGADIVDVGAAGPRGRHAGGDPANSELHRRGEGCLSRHRDQRRHLAA